MTSCSALTLPPASVRAGRLGVPTPTNHPPRMAHAIRSGPTELEWFLTSAPTATHGIYAQRTDIRQVTTPQLVPSRYTTPKMRHPAALVFLIMRAALG